MSKATVLLLGALVMAGCSDRTERWQGFVYPDKTDLTVSIGIGAYADLESCRASALKAINVVKLIRRGGRITLNEALGIEPEGDYECGLNCRREPGMTSLLCDETIR